MRIAFLTHEPFYPPSGGGSAEAIYLVREMVRRGHRVAVFGPEVAEPEEVQRRFGVEWYPFRRWAMGRYTSLRNVKYLLYPFFLERLVLAESRRHPFDLIFSQHAISAVAAGRLRRRLRVPVVTNFLDFLTAFMETWPKYLAPPPALRVLKRFELSIPRRYGVDGVLTVSDTLADYFAETGLARDKLCPIYYGFDAALFPYRESGLTGLGENRAPVIVMHGSLDRHHLGRIALDAAARVARLRPEVTFRFVGQRTAALEGFVARLRAAAPAARVECTGFVPYTEVASHLAGASIGMVPYEASTGTHCAFVAKIVEYLAVGLPVVTTSLASARRYFGEEPMIRFAGFDGDAFAAELLGWLNEDIGAWREAAGRASERVRRELDWGTISRRAVDFVERVAARV